MHVGLLQVIGVTSGTLLGLVVFGLSDPREPHILPPEGVGLIALLEEHLHGAVGLRDDVVTLKVDDLGGDEERDSFDSTAAQMRLVVRRDVDVDVEGAGVELLVLDLESEAMAVLNVRKLDVVQRRVHPELVGHTLELGDERASQPAAKLQAGEDVRAAAMVERIHSSKAPVMKTGVGLKKRVILGVVVVGLLGGEGVYEERRDSQLVLIEAGQHAVVPPVKRVGEPSLLLVELEGEGMLADVGHRVRSILVEEAVIAQHQIDGRTILGQNLELVQREPRVTHHRIVGKKERRRIIIHVSEVRREEK